MRGKIGIDYMFGLAVVNAAPTLPPSDAACKRADHEVAVYAAGAGLDLAQPLTDLDISQAVQLILDQLRDPLEK